MALSLWQVIDFENGSMTKSYSKKSLQKTFFNFNGHTKSSKTILVERPILGNTVEKLLDCFVCMAL